MQKARLIINPIAGTKNKEQLPMLVKKHLAGKLWQIDITYTEARGHATELAREAAAQGYDAVIAAGGDGTVNEIASGLVGTNTALAIIPMGSGNGLARHLGLPMDVEKSIAHLLVAQKSKIDTCTLNGKPFFCTAGMGFDAHIAYTFSIQKTRGLKTYVKTSLQEYFSYQPASYKLHIDGQTFERTAFLITCANAAQFGNNAYIAPMADIRDGFMDICVLKPFSFASAIAIGFRLFTKSIHQSNNTEYWRTKKVVIERQSAGSVHIDGEPMQAEKEIVVEIQHQNLTVLA